MFLPLPNNQHPRVITMNTMINSPVDEETYSMLQEIMADEFDELVECFRLDTEQAVATLQECVDTRNSEHVGAICHKLKSSSKLIGALELAEFARLLENYKYDQNHQEALAHLHKLRSEFARVMDWLSNQHIQA